MRLLLILIALALLTEAKKRRLKKKMKTEDDDEIPHDADVFPEKFIPVPFGHIYKEGFQPKSKLPVELELYNRHTKKVNWGDAESTDARRIEYEKSRRIDNTADYIQFDKKGNPIVDKIDMEDEKDVEKKDSKTEQKMWHDLVVNHARNLGETLRSRNFYGTSGRSSKGYEREDMNSNKTFVQNPDSKSIERFFSKSSFDARREGKRYNWTTCDEFGRNADFHPNDVINIDWIPFYSWYPDGFQKTVSYVHRFSIPTIKLVQKYKEELGMHISKTLDWNSPKLLLKSNMEMLLIAADRRGQFDGIPYNDVPSSMKHNRQQKLPLINLRLKILDPYLAMMFCEYRYATIMAVSGNEPITIQEAGSAAATLKFQGKGTPVYRALGEEREAADLEREDRIKKEKDMFIEDKADLNIPIEI